MLELVVSLLSAPFVWLGGVIGFGIGVLMALGLHWLFPTQDLLFVQTLFVGAGLIAGLVVGGRYELGRR